MDTCTGQPRAEEAALIPDPCFSHKAPPAWLVPGLWRINNDLCCLYCLQCLYTDLLKGRKNALFGKGYLWVICYIKVWEDGWYLNSNSPVRGKVLFLYFVVCSYLQQLLRIYCMRIRFFSKYFVGNAGHPVMLSLGKLKITYLWYCFIH